MTFTFCCLLSPSLFCLITVSVPISCVFTLWTFPHKIITFCRKPSVFQIPVRKIDTFNQILMIFLLVTFEISTARKLRRKNILCKMFVKGWFEKKIIMEFPLRQRVTCSLPATQQPLQIQNGRQGPQNGQRGLESVLVLDPPNVT